MTPESELSNPATSPERLSQIAELRFDLHPRVLAHPQCYPELSNWIVQDNPHVGTWQEGKRPQSSRNASSGQAPTPQPAENSARPKHKSTRQWVPLLVGFAAGVAATAVGAAVVANLLCSREEETTTAAPPAPQPSSAAPRAQSPTAEEVDEPPPTPAPQEPPAPAPAPEEQFVGTWVGDVDQLAARPYTVRLTLEITDEQLTGTSVYPELDECKAELTNPRMEGDVLYIDELVTEGRSRCLDTELRLERDGDVLDYSFSAPATGSATLTRD